MRLTAEHITEGLCGSCIHWVAATQWLDHGVSVRYDGYDADNDTQVTTSQPDVDKVMGVCCCGCTGIKFPPHPGTIEIMCGYHHKKPCNCACYELDLRAFVRAVDNNN